MSVRDVLRRQQELQDAQRARHDRRCSRDDCSQRLARNSATDLCPKHWKLSAGFSERDLAAFRDAPDPPVGMSHALPDQPTNAGSRQWWVMSGCVLCGGPTAHVDQRGVERGPATVTRQLIGLLPAPVPYVVGARCQPCERVIKANADRLHPVIAAVIGMLGRDDFDIFGLRVVAARMGGLPDPEPPDTPWGFTTIGPLDDEVDEPVGDDVQARLSRLERLIASDG